MTKKLISYSVYGNLSKYILGLYENLILIPKVYPGWDVRVYIEKGHYCIPKLKREFPFVQVVEKEKTPGSSGMFWRLEPSFDTSYSHVIVRDIDSRVSDREKVLVDEWIASNKSLHIIRDHPAHNRIKILGGAHGYLTTKCQFMKNELSSWNHSNHYGDDEKFLQERVYTQFNIEEIMAHSSIDPIFGDEVPIAKAKQFVCEPVPPNYEIHLKDLYVINAPHYKERYKKFIEAIKTSEVLSKLNVIRVEGCTLKQQYVPNWFSSSHKHYWLVSQDHKNLYNTLICNNEDLALIFEDDGHPNQNFDEYFRKTYAHLDPNKMTGDTHAPWNALMLGGQSDTHRELVSYALRENLARCTGTLGQHAIMFNRTGLENFYSHAMYWNHETIDQSFKGFQRQFGTVYGTARWVVDIVGIQYGRDN